MLYKELPDKERTYLEIVPNEKNRAFVFRKFTEEKIHDYRHIHQEIELIYIRKGEGKRNINDRFYDFSEGDLALIGPDVPHYYIIEPVGKDKEVEAWVIQFNYDFLGEKFYTYSESILIDRMLRQSNKGIVFHTEIREKAENLLAGISRAEGTEALVLFIRLLDLLSAKGNYSALARNDGSEENRVEIAGKGVDRIRKIQSYIMENLSDGCGLDEISGYIGLSKSAFCNLFRKHFYCSFSEYITGLRISQASRLLAETDLPVSEICYKSGFSNLSYFNRKFREIMNSAPLAYRRSLNSSSFDFRPGKENI